MANNIYEILYKVYNSITLIKSSLDTINERLSTIERKHNELVADIAKLSANNKSNETDISKCDTIQINPLKLHPDVVAKLNKRKELFNKLKILYEIPFDADDKIIKEIIDEYNNIHITLPIYDESNATTTTIHDETNNATTHDETNNATIHDETNNATIHDETNNATIHNTTTKN